MITRRELAIFSCKKRIIYFRFALRELRIIDTNRDIDTYPYFEVAAATSILRLPNHLMRICYIKPASDPLHSDSSAIFCPATVLLFWDWLYAIMKVTQTSR